MFSFTTFLGLVTIGMVSGGAMHKESFIGYELISVTPQTESHVTFINSLEIDGNDELDFWTPPMVKVSGQILVPPGALVFFKAKMLDQGIPWAVETADVDKLLGESMQVGVQGIVGMASSASDFHKKYHDYNAIRMYLYGLAAKYPLNAKVDTLKYKTYEGRSLYRIKLTGDANSSPKKAIIVEAGTHAREWIGPAATLFAIDKLLEGYRGGDPVAKYMLNKYDWHFVPLTNPDGYTYTNTTNRLWRKNRSPNLLNRLCVGADLNRNYDIKFGTTGVSRDCNSLVYPGIYAFSEQETKSIKKLVEDVGMGGGIAGYLAVHSYSQLILLPWGYRKSQTASGNPSNYAEQLRVGNLMARAIKLRHNKTYRVGSPYKLLNYAASGSSSDWALKVNKGIYTMTYELRPSTNSPGFILPSDQIIETGEEFLASLQTFAQEIYKQ